MTEVLCLGCKNWFGGVLSSCPSCGWQRPGFNRWLVHARMDSHLYEMGNRAHSERKILTREQLRPR